MTLDCNIIINPDLCMSRKNNKSDLHIQCTNKKKIGDYCGIHCKSKNVQRIDQLLETKQNNTNKTLNLDIDNENINENNINENCDKKILKKSKSKKYKLRAVIKGYSSYTIKKLLELGNKHNLQVSHLSNNKPELYSKLRIFLLIKDKFGKDSEKIIKLQSLFRGRLIRIMNFLRGPGFFSKNTINNEEDFYTMENKYDIENMYFFSYKDKDNFTYCFDIRSFSKLIENNNSNPYTRNKIPTNIIDNFSNLYRLISIINTNISGNIDSDKPELSKKQQLNQKTMAVFTLLDDLNFYTDFNWFIKLKLSQLKHFYKAAEDIWSYRANLPFNIKNKIRPDKKAFIKSVNDIYQINDLSHLQEIILTEIKKFATLGLTREDRVLGGMYMLTALTEISPECAQALPWLLQQV